MIISEESKMTYKERVQLVKVPSYTKEQERFNFISHFVGVPIGLALIVLAIIFFAKNIISFPYFIGLIIFGLSEISVYLVSAIYHAGDPDKHSKKIKRIIDHCAIYLLVAGTYTPICIYLLKDHIIGCVILALQWSLAIIGIVLNAIDLENKIVKTISMILYLLMGWMILFVGGFIYLPIIVFSFVLAGGIVYTIGSILYGIGHKNANFHGVFHIFCLFGTILQAIGVIILLIS